MKEGGLCAVGYNRPAPRPEPRLRIAVYRIPDHAADSVVATGVLGGERWSVVCVRGDYESGAEWIGSTTTLPILTGGCDRSTRGPQLRRGLPGSRTAILRITGNPSQVCRSHVSLRIRRTVNLPTVAVTASLIVRYPVLPGTCLRLSLPVIGNPIHADYSSLPFTRPGVKWLMEKPRIKSERRAEPVERAAGNWGIPPRLGLLYRSPDPASGDHLPPLPEPRPVGLLRLPGFPPRASRPIPTHSR